MKLNILWQYIRGTYYGILWGIKQHKQSTDLGMIYDDARKMDKVIKISIRCECGKINCNDPYHI